MRMFPPTGYRAPARTLLTATPSPLRSINGGKATCRAPAGAMGSENGAPSNCELSAVLRFPQTCVSVRVGGRQAVLSLTLQWPTLWYELRAVCGSITLLAASVD